MVTSPQTIIEWLNLLPMPYKTQAISHTNPSSYQAKANNMLSALGSAFNWSYTIEGPDALIQSADSGRTDC